MHIKRFEADDLEAALAAVKAELGEDALILSSRTIRKGGRSFGLLGRSRVEVQAALERGADRPGAARPDRRADRPRQDAAGAPTRDGLEADRSVLPTGRDGDASAGTGDAASLALMESLRRELARQQARESFEEELRSELRGLRRALGRVLQTSGAGTVDAEVEAVARRGIDWVHAESIVRERRERAEAGEAATVDGVLAARLEKRIVPPREDARGRLRVLVGAPGVGKTTSLAKLAARNEEGEREVALVSLDHYRVGASDQLRHYAELLEAPFHEIDAVGELGRLSDGRGSVEWLVDTAGRDRAGDRRLGSLLPLRERFGGRTSIELVIDATARLEVQRAQLERFAPLAPDRLLLCKVDECEGLGDVANLLLDPGCPPLCWLGTGQRVPEDLDEARSAPIVRDLMGRAA